MFPKALVFCDDSGPIEVWSLESAGQATIGLGNSFRAAKGAVYALIAAERAKSGSIKK